MSLLSWAQAFYCMLLKAVFSHFSSSNGIPLHPSKAGPVLGLSGGVCPHAEGLWVEPARKVQHLGPDVRNQPGPDPEQLRLRAPTDFAVPENHRPLLPGECDPAFICFWTFCRRCLVISFKLGLLTILWSHNPCSILWFYVQALLIPCISNPSWCCNSIFNWPLFGKRYLLSYSHMSLIFFPQDSQSKIDLALMLGTFSL